MFINLDAEWKINFRFIGRLSSSTNFNLKGTIFMKNKKLKYALHFLICFVTSFICIYLIIFAGGWRLFEGGDPILLEIAAAIVIGFFIWLIYEWSALFECKIKELEERIEELEKKN